MPSDDGLRLEDFHRVPDEPIAKEIFIAATPEEIFPYLTQFDKYGGGWA
jgi:hypothetical protein